MLWPASMWARWLCSCAYISAWYSMRTPFGCVLKCGVVHGQLLYCIFVIMGIWRLCIWNVLFSSFAFFLLLFVRLVTSSMMLSPAVYSIISYSLFDVQSSNSWQQHSPYHYPTAIMSIAIWFFGCNQYGCIDTLRLPKLNIYFSRLCVCVCVYRAMFAKLWAN